MPKIVITHKVVDTERWLKGKAERAAVISAYATHVTDFVAGDGSNNIAVTADVHDMAGAQAMMASPSQVSILGLDNVLFAVGDLATARAFYEDRLGLKVKFAAPEQGIVGYALGSEEPGLVVRQGVLSDSGPRETPKVWLEVADARTAAEILVGGGILPLAGPFEIPTGWTVEVADPWGNIVGLTDYVKAPTMARRPVAS